MKSANSIIALVASFATLIQASPLHMQQQHAERQVQVHYVTDTDITTEYTHVTKYVTAGAPEASPPAFDSQSHGPEGGDHVHQADAGHHWSWNQENAVSSSQVAPPSSPTTTSIVSTTAAPPPAPTTPVAVPSSTSIAVEAKVVAPTTPVAVPSSTSIAVEAKVVAPATTQAPAGSNADATDAATVPYTTAVPAPASSIVATTGDESYNAHDGTLQAASLKYHNDARSQFQAGAVTWNITLEQFLVNVNNNQSAKCLFQHSSDGQNIAATYDSPQAAIGGWMSEYNAADFSTGDYKGGANHFSQVVWQATTSIGCAAINCDNFPGATAHGWFYACNYYPIGNFQIGDDDSYGDNVKNKAS